MFLYNKSKAFCSKFVSGGFGLAVTFWVFGVLVAIVLGLLMKKITAPWQLIVFTLIVITQFVLITIAVWNAANKYSGSLLWSWGAKVTVIAGVARWLWFSPDLAAALLGAVGMPIHSSEYWELNVSKLQCEPALYQFTPERMKKKHQSCISVESANSQIINLRCQVEGINTELFYTRNLNDCNKNLDKLRSYYKNKK